MVMATPNFDLLQTGPATPWGPPQVSDEEEELKDIKHRYGLQQVNKYYSPLSIPAARFFVIKSLNETSIYKSLKYKVWSSTKDSNKKIN
mmetsp:Transcript_29904/g.22160  ORF Transcript_29904/g.22160 Transcript_29904/m.22160 type:complete len:89 (+) Transcript_29904:309-575(+)